MGNQSFELVAGGVGSRLEGWLSLSNDPFKSAACPIVGPAFNSIRHARTRASEARESVTAKLKR
jgi:hypothetical protein